MNSVSDLRVSGYCVLLIRPSSDRGRLSFAGEGKELAVGCTGYLTKPIDPDTFADSIAKYLD